jgi:hypothetical protein
MLLSDAFTFIDEAVPELKGNILMMYEEFCPESDENCTLEEVPNGYELHLGGVIISDRTREEVVQMYRKIEGIHHPQFWVLLDRLWYEEESWLYIFPKTYTLLEITTFNVAKRVGFPGADGKADLAEIDCLPEELRRRIIRLWSQFNYF